jgi:uncharacterized membrane protein
VTYLILGLVLFIGVHSISIVGRGWRDRMVENYGTLAWRAFYGLASLAGLVLIVHGYALARLAPVIVYAPPLWTRGITVPLMVFVFPLLFSAYLPGIIGTMAKHPLLVAVKLWATLHLLVNGSLADIFLFGSLLAWAVVVRISIKRHPRPPVRTAPPSKWNDAIALVAGFAVYAAMIMGGHQWLIGVPALLPRVH